MNWCAAGGSSPFTCPSTPSTEGPRIQHKCPSPTPFPPLVASPGIDSDIAERLREALLSAHNNPEMRQLFERVLVERVLVERDGVPELADYSLGAELDREALSAGYPMPA